MIKVKYQNKNFLPEENTIVFNHESGIKRINLHIGLYSDKFKEYQKNLFSEFFSKILEIEEKNDNFLDFKKQLESEIKQFNTQLKIFQEKINSEEKIEIRGSLQVIWGENYLAGLVGETSLIIFRKNKLEAVIVNDVEPEDKIDIFSEIIEGELENNDQIIQVACNINNYLSDNEIKDIINTEDMIFTLEEILKTRIQKEEIGFILLLGIEYEKIIIKSENKKNIDYTKIISKYKYPIISIASLVVVVLLIIGIFSYISKPDNTATVVVNGEKIQTNLDEVKRQIDAFGKLNNTNTDVAKQQYENIMKELNELEKSKIQVLEVKELKKKMEQLYFKGFHINIVGENDGLLTKVYSFSQKEVSSLSGVNGLTFSNGYLNIFGPKGVILNIVNNKTKGVLQTLTLPTKIKTCKNNLANNGLYCLLDNNDIYNFSKYGLAGLTNLNNSWPSNITDIGTYGINKFYVLTKDSKLNQNNTYIVRYVLRGGNKFGKANPYVFSDKVDDKILKGIYSGSSLAIDGTFLIWTKEGLVQVYRKNIYATKVSARIVSGWEKGIINQKNDFKGKVKVISFPNDKYVYLYDYNTNSLVVYLTTPYKTNSAYTTSYKLKYEYKVKFDLSNQNVKDVDIHYNPALNQRTVYVLTNKNIYKVNLGEFEEN